MLLRGGGLDVPRRRFLAGVPAFVLACILLIPLSGGADTACTVSGSVATCTGDQSDGIKNGTSFSSSIISLNVQSLSASIGPSLSGNLTSGGNQAGIILEYADTSGGQTIQLNYNGSGSSGVQVNATSGSGFYIYNSGSVGHDDTGDNSHAGGTGGSAYATNITASSLSTMSITGTSTLGINVSGIGGHGGTGGTPDLGVGGVGGGGGTGGSITLSLTATTINASGQSAIGVQLYSAGGTGG